MLLLLESMWIILLAEQDEKIKKMQEIYFYAKDCYQEGMYEKAIKEFEEILSLSPDHRESLRMIAECKEKIGLTENLINKALDKYRDGSLSEALEKLEDAHTMDRKNFEVKSLMGKILTELGMEYSFVGEHEKARNYLERAKVLAPWDKTIQDLIDMNKSIAQESAETYVEEGGKSEEVKNIEEVKEIEEGKKFEEMFAAFEKYQEQQNKILKKYTEKQARLQGLLESSEKEKEKLYALLQERNTAVNNVIKKAEKLNLFFKRNLLWFAGLAVLAAILSGVILVRKLKVKKDNYLAQSKLQKEMLESFDKLSGESQKRLSEYEKKNKRLEIIEAELVGDRQFENQVALRMLSTFFEDAEYRIRLRAVKLLHRIDSHRAVQILWKIIKQETGEIRVASCSLLGEMSSDVSVKLLLKLADVRNDELKKAVLASLVRILNSEGTAVELKKKIRYKLDEISSGGDWIVT